MLTVQPYLVNKYNKFPTFGNCPVDNSNNDDSQTSNACTEEPEDTEAKEALALLKQVRQNINGIAESANSITPLNKAFMILSNGIAVLIGWAGLRWGTEGTLKVLSNIGKTGIAQSVKTSTGSAYTYAKGWLSSGKNYVKNHNWYRSIANAMNGVKESFLETKVGETLTEWKDSIKASSIYNHAVEAKDSTMAYVKKLNPERVFVEAMGVAGGGTALVNVLGGDPINGVKHNVSKAEDGYRIDGKKIVGSSNEAISSLDESEIVGSSNEAISSIDELEEGDFYDAA